MLIDWIVIAIEEANNVGMELRQVAQQSRFGWWRFFVLVFHRLDDSQFSRRVCRLYKLDVPFPRFEILDQNEPSRQVHGLLWAHSRHEREMVRDE